MGNNTDVSGLLDIGSKRRSKTVYWPQLRLYRWTAFWK